MALVPLFLSCRQRPSPIDPAGLQCCLATIISPRYKGKARSTSLLYYCLYQYSIHPLQPPATSGSPTCHFPWYLPLGTFSARYRAHTACQPVFLLRPRQPISPPANQQTQPGQPAFASASLAQPKTFLACLPFLLQNPFLAQETPTIASSFFFFNLHFRGSSLFLFFPRICPTIRPFCSLDDLTAAVTLFFPFSFLLFSLSSRFLCHVASPPTTHRHLVPILKRLRRDLATRNDSSSPT